MKKSQLAQFLVALLLGPLGLLYSNVVIGIELTVAGLILGSIIGNEAVMVMWPISIIAGFFMVRNYNALVEKEEQKHKEETK